MAVGVKRRIAEPFASPWTGAVRLISVSQPGRDKLAAGETFGDVYARTLRRFGKLEKRYRHKPYVAHFSSGISSPTL